MLAGEIQTGLPLVLHLLRDLLRHVLLPSPDPCVSRFVALHTYSAHRPEELDLQKGEGIRVLGKYQDGWLKGLSLLTGRTGIFPSDYVIPVFRYVSRALLCVELIMADPVSFSEYKPSNNFCLHIPLTYTQNIYNFFFQRSHRVFISWAGT